MQSLRFRLFGFDVEIQPTFLLVIGIALLFELQYAGNPAYALVWGGVVLVSVIVHELGHASLARWYGLRVGKIELHWLGGQVSHAPTRPARQLAISLAGPAAGLLLGGLTALVGVGWALADLPLVPTMGRLFQDLLWVNLFWSVFNLLPLMPLDGGNALRAGLTMAWGERRALRATSGVGLVVGAAVLLFGFQYGSTFIAMLGGAAAYTNFQVLQSLR